MPSEQQKQAVAKYVEFVKEHVKKEYAGDKSANVDGVSYQIVDGRVWHPLGGQAGMYLDTKIGSRAVKGRYAIASDKCVLLAGIDKEEGWDRYFGIVFHEYGHAAFDSIGRNSEHGAFTVELSCLVAAVLANLVPLADAQSYAAARIGAGMLLGDFTLATGNAQWATRAHTCREYLQNRHTEVIAYPYRQHV